MSERKCRRRRSAKCSSKLKACKKRLAELSESTDESGISEAPVVENSTVKSVGAVKNNSVETVEKSGRSGIIALKGDDYSTRNERGQFTGSVPHDGGAGGKITDKNYTQIEKFEKQAKQFYRARIDEGTKDVEMIASNTGFSYEDIQSIKNYVMLEEHLFSDGTVRRFDSDIDQALAWQRLMENRFTDIDILLLNHELRELKYMKSHQCDYETAHAYATQKYDWQSAVDSIVDSDDINLNLL